MNDSTFENNDDADDANLLRSLKPSKPEVNWQAIIGQLQTTSSPNDQVVVAASTSEATGSSWRSLISSWWSGALAGSLITLAILQASKLASPDSNSVRTELALPVSASDSRHEKAPIDDSAVAKNIAHAESTAAGDLVANWNRSTQDPLEVYPFRHGITMRMVSRSEADFGSSFTSRSNSTNSIEADEPSTAATLRKKLLEIN